MSECRYGFGDCSCVGESGSWEFSADITFGQGTKFWGVEGITLANLSNVEHFPFSRAAEVMEYGGIIDQRARQLGYITTGRYGFREGYLSFTRPIKSGSSMVITVRQTSYGKDDFPRGSNPFSGFDKSSHSIGLVILPFLKYNTQSRITPAPFGVSEIYAPLKDAAAQGAISQTTFQIILDNGELEPTYPAGEFLIIPVVSRYYENGPLVTKEEVLQEFRDQDEKGAWNGVEFDKFVNNLQYLGQRQFREQVGPPGTKFEIRGTVFEPEQ